MGIFSGYHKIMPTKNGNHFFSTFISVNFMQISDKHLGIKFSRNFQWGILKALKDFDPSKIETKTFTSKGIFGITRLYATITSNKNLIHREINKSYANECSCKLNENLEMQIAAELSTKSSVITLVFMITHRKLGWSVGGEMVLSLNPSDFKKRVSSSFLKLRSRYRWDKFKEASHRVTLSDVSVTSDFEGFGNIDYFQFVPIKTPSPLQC